MVPDGILANKSFQWTRKIVGNHSSTPLSNDGTTTISSNSLNSPESTSVLNSVENAQGTYTYNCIATVTLDSTSNISSSASVNVSVIGKYSGENNPCVIFLKVQSLAKSPPVSSSSAEFVMLSQLPTTFRGGNLGQWVVAIACVLIPT